MPTFLLKTEPSEYSFSDLARDKKTTWTGVTNPGALITLRSIKKGDELFIYHTGDEKAIVGLAKALTNSFEDPAKPGTTDMGAPKFAVLDLAPVRAAKKAVTLAQIKADKRFAEFLLVKNSRLSAMPVPATLDKLIREWAGF
jgi:predicted RNA-binding protein with PUA-like domain